jgi:hypothetical protein
VDGKRQPDELGRDRGTPRPRLDELAIVARNGSGHLLLKVAIDERAFLD